MALKLQIHNLMYYYQFRLVSFPEFKYEIKAKIESNILRFTANIYNEVIF